MAIYRMSIHTGAMVVAEAKPERLLGRRHFKNYELELFNRIEAEI